MPRQGKQTAEPRERLGPAGIDGERGTPMANGGERVTLCPPRQPCAEQRAVLVGRPVGRDGRGDPRGFLVLADIDKGVGEPDHGHTVARIGQKAPRQSRSVRIQSFCCCAVRAFCRSSPDFLL